MAVRSSAPAVKNALYDRLVLRPGLISSGLLISYGPPVKPPREYVWVAAMPEHTQRQIGMGPAPHTREEDYILEVIVHVERPGGQQQECTERAYDLAAEVEDEIADDPRINYTISEGYLAEVDGLPLVEAGDDVRRWAEVSVRIRCRTIIRP